MKIGIVSDSHGKASRLRDALRLLGDQGARAVVHCGDVGSTECMEMLGRSRMKAFAVTGNVDRLVGELAAAAGRTGVQFHSKVIEVPLGDGRSLVATHGDDLPVLISLIAGGQFPYVCHGHTHRVRNERSGGVRIICPGALRQPRDPRHPTAALLDTDSDAVDFIQIPH